MIWTYTISSVNVVMRCVSITRKSITSKMINHAIAGKKLEDFIHNILTSWGFHVIREYPIYDERFRQKFKQRKIDIKYTYGKMERYFEVDGKVHGDLENPTQSTLDRNTDFAITDIPYSTLNTESITTIRRIMQGDGKLKNIQERDLIEFLIAYMAWHEYTKYLARVNGGCKWI